MSDQGHDPNQFEQGQAPVSSRTLGARPDLLRVGLVAVVCVALVVGAILVNGASIRPSGPAPDAAAGATADDGDEDVNDEAFDDEGLDENDQGEENKEEGSRFSGITITSINGTRIGLATEDGWTRTIDIATTTDIRRGDAAAKAAVLRVGDEVRIRQRRNDDGSVTIVAIVVRVPRAAGEVTGVSDNSITVKRRGGASLTITVTGSTTYKLGPNPGSKSDVKVGSRVAAEGERDAAGAFNASLVRIALAELSGEVTAKTGDSLTITRRDGTTRTVHVGAGTTFRVRGSGSAAGSLADIAVGNRVQVEGNLRADGSLDAVVVRVGKVKAPKPKESPSG